MANLLKRRSIHSGRLERWLGKEKLEDIAFRMRNGGGMGHKWYGPPIYLLDVPGEVWITGDGDFVGGFKRGAFDSALDSFQRHLRALWVAAGKPIYQPEPVFSVGFTSVSDVLSKQSQGYGQDRTFFKNGGTATVGQAMSLWRLPATPAAGSTGAAAPGGTVHTSADTGALTYTNPATGTMHLVGADAYASIANQSIFVYDRLFSVAKTINSTATEAVTGVPTRYQNTTATAADYIGGNFLTVFTGATAMAATAHNWTVCTYTNQANTAGQTLPSVIGVSGALADSCDLATPRWFAPLANNDTGIKALTQMQCSALVATGSAEFVIGHGLGLMVFPVGSVPYPFDWLTNKKQLPRVFDNACISFMEWPKQSASATTYGGAIYLCNAP